MHLYGTVTDGYLTLTFTDEGGTDPEWIVNRISLVYQNGRPTANDISTNVMGGASVDIPLSGSDPDGNPITFHLADPPQHGTFDGTTYTADASFSGTDSFTYTARDTYVDGPPATVTIAVAENPDMDGDGIDNRTEYAFGGDPLDPNSKGTLPRLIMSPSNGSYIYVLRNDPSLTATRLISFDLMSSNWIPASVQTGSGSPGGFTFYTNTIPFSFDTIFIKLHID